MPHILGLTASAIYNPDNPEKSFDELQTNLDSVIINVRDQKVEVEGYTQKPLERPLYYSSEALLQPPTDFEIMLDELEIWEYVNQEKIENRIDNVKSVSGSGREILYTFVHDGALALTLSLHPYRPSEALPAMSTS